MSHASFPRVPVDLILHATAEALHTLTVGAVSETRLDDADELAALRHALTHCISPGSVAEEWAADGEVCRHATRVAAICSAVHSTRVASVGLTRAIEIAIARRLADTACALRITGGAEDAAHAEALWRAAGAIVGMQAEPVTAPSGFKVPTPGELAEYVHGRVSIDPLLETLRRALGVDPHADIVAHARNIKAQLDNLNNDWPKKCLRTCAEEAAKQTGDKVIDSPTEQVGIIGKALRDGGRANEDRRAAWAIHDTLTGIIGGRDISEAIANAKAAKAAIIAAIGGTLSDETTFTLAELAAELAASAMWLKDTSARRLNTITEHDKRDADIAAALGAQDGEDNFAAAKRVRDERDALEHDIGERVFARTVVITKERDDAIIWRDTARMECDAAIEARAQMQARLVAVESELDAAQEEAKTLRVQLAPPSGPKVGDSIPWDQTEDGCLYADGKDILAQWSGRCVWVFNAKSKYFETLFDGGGWPSHECKDGDGPNGILIASGLGSDPEEWRAAIRSFTPARA